MCLAIIYQSIIHGCSKGVLEFTIKVTPIIGYTFVHAYNVSEFFMP